ncbi:3334_t:CDS:2 [Ambispora leptoticha]|uniref:3334_t:CDS:1 n=1 Tax=Ambispora leptoticha TaxID=144679 RepID=A0A9N9APQ3_9GLOM|nr:3334_t:CDS:2 [Ambispora leptoticha]
MEPTTETTPLLTTTQTVTSNYEENSTSYGSTMIYIDDNGNQHEVIKRTQNFC